MIIIDDLIGKKIDEVFIGSCMTNIGHFRAAGERENEYMYMRSLSGGNSINMTTNICFMI